jgi:hypothetical protein
MVRPGVALIVDIRTADVSMDERARKKYEKNFR